MAKRKKTSFSGQHTKLEVVEEYYTDSEESLNAFYNVNLLTGTIPAKFIGYTRQEIDNELKERKKILDRMCSLELLSAIEARVRIDYIIRGQNKLRDDFSRKIRDIYDIKENHASLVDDILRIWKVEKPNHKTRLDELGKALDYRHWLAHGRYWQPKRKPHIEKYDYLSLYALAANILNNLELIESA